MSVPALSPVGAYLRRHDSDAFLADLLVPAAWREDYFVLSAFQHEIGSIRGKVSEPQLGRIRLQWWREALETIAAGGRIPAHEVLLPLGACLQAGRVPVAPLLGMLQAHERDFTDEAWSSLTEIQQYAAATTCPVFSLKLSLTGMETRRIDSVAHLATGLGLVRILGRGQQGPLDPRAVAALAMDNLRLPNGWSRTERRLLVQVRLARLRLSQYQQCGFRRDDARFGAIPARRGLVLARAALFG